MIDTAWAQTGGAAGAPPTIVSFLPLALVFGVFYFLLIRPQQLKAKEHKVILANLKKNDEIITSSGIYGTVVSVSETEDEMTVKVADNVRIRVLKSGVARNLTTEKAAREARDTSTAITPGPNTSVTGGKTS